MSSSDRLSAMIDLTYCINKLINKYLMRNYINDEKTMTDSRNFKLLQVRPKLPKYTQVYLMLPLPTV